MSIPKAEYYIGTSRGVLLCSTDKPNDIKVFKNGESTEVTSLTDGRNDEELILGYRSGSVHIFNREQSCFAENIANLEGDESVIGISCIQKTIIVAKHDGIINLWTKKKNDYFSLNLEEGSTLDAMASDPNQSNIIGTGGEKNDYKLWDIETQQCIFKAKSLGHDHLQLPIPTSLKGISFFTNESNLGACCTKEGHVLLYDNRAQRRPVVKFLEEKASYTTITSAFRDRQVLVGTTKGYMQWLDLKQPAKVLKTYTTFTGCVSDIVCDPLEPYVASVSLDRYLRVHKMDSKELINKIYMKQNLTKLLVKPIIKDDPELKDEDIDEEYEALFENMEKIEEGKEKKRKKRVKPIIKDDPELKDEDIDGEYKALFENMEKIEDGKEKKRKKRNLKDDSQEKKMTKKKRIPGSRTKIT